jgi:uncharacterized protein YcbX
VARATLAAIYRYPVKGLSPEALPRVVLAAGETLPFDRAYAIANGPAPFDPAAPMTIPKAYFLMLMKNERLAALRTRFDDRRHHLTVVEHGAAVAEGRLDSAEGRAAIEAYFNRAFKDELRGPARVLHSPRHSFSDTAAKALSAINLATVQEIAGKIRRPVDPLRFRGNLLLDGLEPWAEFSWVGRRIRIGNAILEGLARIDRCAATNVDPRTGGRDLQIPDGLRAAYGHIDCGIYLKVVAGGAIVLGDAVTAD